jgi:hypothetical protein
MLKTTFSIISVLGIGFRAVQKNSQNIYLINPSGKNSGQVFFVFYRPSCVGEISSFTSGQKFRIIRGDLFQIFVFHFRTCLS